MLDLAGARGGIDQAQFLHVDQGRLIADDRIMRDAAPEVPRAFPVRADLAHHVDVGGDVVALLAGDRRGLQRDIDDHADEGGAAALDAQAAPDRRTLSPVRSAEVCGRPMLAREPLTAITTPRSSFSAGNAMPWFTLPPSGRA